MDILVNQLACDNKLREKFPLTSFTGRCPILSEAGIDLLNKLLTHDPEKRITAEDALNHAWFREVPLPKSKDFMPTFPAQHAQDRRLRRVIRAQMLKKSYEGRNYKQKLGRTAYLVKRTKAHYDVASDCG